MSIRNLFLWVSANRCTVISFVGDIVVFAQVFLDLTFMCKRKSLYNHGFLLTWLSFPCVFNDLIFPTRGNRSTVDIFYLEITFSIEFLKISFFLARQFGATRVRVSGERSS